MSSSLLKLRYPELQNVVASVCSGSIVVNSRGRSRLRLSKILLDTGALHSSYIAKRVVDKYRRQMQSRIRQVNGVVKLGDNKTSVTVSERVTLPVELVDWKGVQYVAMIDLCVWDMSDGLDMIIGLPDILASYLEFLVDVLQAARDNVQSEVFKLEERYTDLQLPWTVVQEVETEEERESYIPCSFTGPLYYLSKPHTEVIADYRADFESHIAPDWKEKTDIEKFLMSEKALAVFCPAEWKGLTGFEPLELSWKDEMPKVYKPPCRPINPRLYEAASAEFKRMDTYMYTASDSPIACPLVIAPKATKPFIRICGDYVWINRWLYVGHYYIPHVMHELEKAAGFDYFIDLDLTNSFHQIPLGPITSNRLSVITPWGLRRPVFLPEGVAPASGTLQKMVMEIFNDFSPWTIVIFDNILVLCKDHSDGMSKLKLIIDKCFQRQVVLKFSKSWIGFKQVKFFGYKVHDNRYELDEDRKQAVMDAPFPTNMKAMQRFLGVAVFFNEFIPNFATVTGSLYEMIKPTFKWEPSTWTVDYASEYQKVKDALCASVAKHFPDYERDWILRVDASQAAVMAVLLQIVIGADGKEIYHPIGFKSKKLSGSACNWDAHKREAYAVYFGCKAFAYYLHGKQFILETDHANLLYMEKSDVYIVIRWRIYLQSLMFLLRHIPGKKNIVADWGSRMYHLLSNGTTDQQEPEPDLEQELPAAKPQSVEEALSQVHGGRMFHYGPRKTWQLLNKYFPGHSIPYRVVVEYCTECPRCQKDKKVWSQDIQPLVRTVIPKSNRSRLGIDALTISPADEDGNCQAIVIVNLKTKLVMIYPAKDYTMDTAAAAIFVYITRYGLHDEIITDPGSMFISDSVNKVNSWLGIRHKLSLVDVHESNGVERTNQEILKLLRTLVNDERIRKQWSKPWNVGLVEFQLNSRISTETKHSAYELTFGTEDAKHFKIPDALSSEEVSNEYLKQLNETLRVVRELTDKHQQELIADRAKHNPQPERWNTFQAGDFVLYDTLYDPCQYRVPKLNSRHRGPYEVIKQIKNDVEARHLNLGSISVLPVSRLSIFTGTREEGVRLAMEDADQFNIVAITAWRGNPEVRTTMEFEVLFESEAAPVWLVWSRDLSDSEPFEQYCRSQHPLYPLVFDLQSAYKDAKAALNRSPITEVAPGRRVYLSLRFFSTKVYDEDLTLPDKYHVEYVVLMDYTKWTNRTHNRIDGTIPVLRTTTEFNHLNVVRWGRQFDLPINGIVVDADFIRQHKDVLQLILDGKSRTKLAKLYT